jgi:hypothetical protein
MEAQIEQNIAETPTSASNTLSGQFVIGGNN